MELIEVINLAIGALTLLGLLYALLWKPQERSKEFDVVIEEKFRNHEKNQTETINLIKESFTAQIAPLTANINNLRENHLHTEETLAKNLEQQGKYINDLSKDVGELKGCMKIYFDKK